jgi:hypothetical protein
VTLLCFPTLLAAFEKPPAPAPTFKKSQRPNRISFLLSSLFLFPLIDTMTEHVMPPHPGLDNVDLDGLKHKCPAFATGCPYAKIEEVESLAVSFGELSKW